MSHQISWFAVTREDRNDEYHLFTSEGYPPPEGASVWLRDYREPHDGNRRAKYRVMRVEWSVTLLKNVMPEPLCNVILEPV